MRSLVSRVVLVAIIPLGAAPARAQDAPPLPKLATEVAFPNLRFDRPSRLGHRLTDPARRHGNERQRRAHGGSRRRRDRAQDPFRHQPAWTMARSRARTISAADVAPGSWCPIERSPR